MSFPVNFRRKKFNNKIVILDGLKFHSKLEANRYLDLKIELACGTITNLQLQVPVVVRVNGETICRYYADFVYERNGQFVIEDAKGVKTAVFNLKWKLVKALYGHKYTCVLHPEDTNKDLAALRARMEDKRLNAKKRHRKMREKRRKSGLMDVVEIVLPEAAG